MTKALLSLGSFQFTVGRTMFDSLARKTGYKWAQHERLGSYPALDFTGHEAATVEVAGEAFAARTAGDDPLRGLKDEADKGEPLLLVDADGKAHGRWAVLSVAEDLAAYGGDGKARRNAFRVSLLRVWDEKDASSEYKAI